MGSTCLHFTVLELKKKVTLTSLKDCGHSPMTTLEAIETHARSAGSVAHPLYIYCCSQFGTDDMELKQ